MAGQRKTCPKCHTEIVVPSPSPGSAASASAPVSTPSPNRAAGPTPLAIPWLLWIGIPLVAIVVGIIIANSRRRPAQTKPEGVPPNAAQAAASPNKDVPAKKEEPKTDDLKWRNYVENYLNANEHKYTITKNYPTEPVAGAYYHMGGKDDGTWLPLDRPPALTDELSAASLPAAQAKELEKLQGKPLEKLTLDDLLKIETEGLKKLDPDELRKSAAGTAKSVKPEDLKKIQEQELQKKKEEEKKYERICAGRALRVEFDADEGFGRIKHHDEVFVIDAEGNVVQRLNTEDFRLGKP